MNPLNNTPSSPRRETGKADKAPPRTPVRRTQSMDGTMGMLFLSDIKGGDEILAFENRYAAYAAEPKPCRRRRRASIASPLTIVKPSPAETTMPQDKSVLDDNSNKPVEDSTFQKRGRSRASVASTLKNSTLKPPLTESPKKESELDRRADPKPRKRSGRRRPARTSTADALVKDSALKPPLTTQAPEEKESEKQLGHQQRAYHSPRAIKKGSLGKVPRTPTQYLRQKISRQPSGDGSECDTWALSASTPLSKSSTNNGLRSSGSRISSLEPCLPSSLDRQLRMSSIKSTAGPPTEIFIS